MTRALATEATSRCATLLAARTRLRTGLIWLTLAATLAPALGPRSARAATVAESLADQAMRAYKAGDFDRAIELYLAAYAQAPAEVVLLYNAARVAHTSHRFDRAEELYRQVLAHPASDEARRTTVQGYLVALQHSRAEEQAVAARDHAAAGRHAAAAVAYRAAWRDLPKRVDYLLEAARASRLAGEFDLAERDYATYITKAQPGGSRADAIAELAALRARRAPAAAQPLPEPATPVQGPRPLTVLKPPLAAVQRQPPTAPVWTLPTLAGGALAAAVGAGVLVWSQSEGSRLTQEVAPAARPLWTYDDARARAATLETRMYAGWALSALGLATAAASAWVRYGRSTPTATEAAAPRAAFTLLPHGVACSIVF